MNVETENLTASTKVADIRRSCLSICRLNPAEKKLCWALLCAVGGFLLYACLVSYDVQMHDGDRVQDCVMETNNSKEDTLHEQENMLPSMFGCTIAHQTMVLIVILGVSIDLVTAARNIKRPQNDLSHTGVMVTLALTACGEIVLAILQTIFVFTSPDIKSCLKYRSFVWYGIWYLPCAFLLALLCLTLSVGIIGLVCVPTYLLIQHCMAAYREARSYSPL